MIPGDFINVRQVSWEDFRRSILAQVQMSDTGVSEAFERRCADVAVLWRVVRLDGPFVICERDDMPPQVEGARLFLRQDLNERPK